jgi:hypothetical protein
MTPDANQSLDEVLQSAVIVSWKDLMQENQAGLIHLEYGFTPAGTLDYLKAWSSIKPGHWLLACEYWMSASTFHGIGIRFDNGYESEGLAHILELVMQHQSSFVLPESIGRQGLLKISSPTDEQSTGAATAVDLAFNHPGTVSKRASPESALA